MDERPINVLIGGEAGQGIATVGEILLRSCVRAGYWIVVTQSYESRIRGGHSTFGIRISERELFAPCEPVDVLVALNEETFRLHRHEISDRGILVLDSSFDVTCPACLKVPFKDLSEKRFVNVTALGVVAATIGLQKEHFLGAFSDFFGKHGDSSVRGNQEAFAVGYKWASEQPQPFECLPAPTRREKMLTVNGNEAIALGALSAGLKLCSFYPMTPATSIVNTVIQHAKKMGVIVEQAEDEIAAVNMAIGASFAGAPSMVATSGGGFALMTEGISLAAMTETPLVVVVAQRPGPATGLPTRTEQGDLEFVLHAGHGEFPRAIYAPGTVEQCFHLTRKAFELAHKVNGPVFVLTDQFLADTYRAVQPFPIEYLDPVATCADSHAFSSPHQSYALSDTGISARLIPGLSLQCTTAFSSEQLVMADSDEHDELGHITEDLSLRKRMVDKRLKKLDTIMEEVMSPEMIGDEQPDLMLMCWGSTLGAVLEAASELRKRGRSVATLHFAQVWPLRVQPLRDILGQANEVVCIESNATCQLARLIRRETGFEAYKSVLRYDGHPITPESILRELDPE